MWLTDIEADRLRNLKAVSLGLPAGLSVIAAPNGQGKTSLLEAIYLLATGRSFRTRRIDELVAWNGGPLRVAGTVAHRVGRTRLTVIVDGEARSLLADGNSRPFDDFIGRLDVVDLTADRIRVLRGGPDERRRFLDRGLVGLQPSLLRVLGEYRKTLAQRNALLRSGSGPREAELRVWDERLVGAAFELHVARREYGLRLAAELGEAGRVLFPGGEEPRLRYRPSPARAAEQEPSKFPDIFADFLLRNRKRDLALGHTFGGPHRDDLVLELNGVDLRRFGSAGQLRASLVVLKLGKLCLLQKDRGEAPLFLMDDYDSDLDERRAGDLARYLDAAGFQALIATSKESLADRWDVPCARFRIEDGVARAA